MALTSSTSRSSLIEEGYIYDLSSYACERDENKCHFHTYVENSKTLHVVGQGKFCVKRVNAPVPDCSDESAHAALAHFTMFNLNE